VPRHDLIKGKLMKLSPILYVEDEENDALLVQFGFRRAGIRHPILVLPSGLKAQEYLAGTGDYEHRPHPLPCLVLLDLNLPLLSGLELLDWMKQNPGLATLPVVIFTSSEQARDRERARELGADDYLVKPAGIEELAELARSLDERWLKACVAVGSTSG
jgi:CheY-like chemotaxis protein